MQSTTTTTAMVMRSQRAQPRTVFEATCGSDGIKHMTYGQYVLAKWAFFRKTGKGDGVAGVDDVEENKNLITSAQCSFLPWCFVVCFATPISFFFFVLFSARFLPSASPRLAVRWKYFAVSLFSAMRRTLSFTSRCSFSSPFAFNSNPIHVFCSVVVVVVNNK